MVRKEDYKIPEYIIDKDKYKEAFLIAKETYRSMYIAKKYKQMGGKYDDDLKKKGKRKTDLWLDEKWVQVKPFVKEGKKVRCGAGDGGKACRPLQNVKGGDKTLTMNDIIKKWGKEKVLKLVEQRIENMSGRLDWEKGKFYRK